MKVGSQLGKGHVHSGCFACGGRNPRGLGLEFRRIGKQRVGTECVLGEEYQGYPGIVQGGIVCTLLDSAVTNCLFSDGVEAMTARLNVRFSEPILVDRRLTVSACVVRQRGRFYELKAWIMQDDKQKASAEAKLVAGRTRR
jgi:acyl-coenzyme A thioesterase PaaI-like protein